MARTILTAVLIVLLNVLVSCSNVDSGRGQLVPTRLKTSPAAAPIVRVADAGETDIVEQVAVNRQAYQQGLNLLIKYYARAGDDMKLVWAKKELAALDAIPQYNYIVEAGVAGPNLKASASIPDADELYYDALALQKKAERLIVIKDSSLLRLALDKYNQLIRKHPSSDKIDDAAFKAGRIYEHFKDYTIAVLYYKRAHQWDPLTIHPAAFRAAYVLDKRLHRRAEALEFYRQAVQREYEQKSYKEFAENRIKELTKTGEGGEQH